MWNSTGISAEASPWRIRGHFFAAAAEAMRRILVEQARRKQALKQAATGANDMASGRIRDGPTLDIWPCTICRAQRQAQAELVKLRYFAGLTITQAAEVLGVSPSTANRLGLRQNLAAGDALRPNGLRSFAIRRSSGREERRFRTVLRGQCSPRSTSMNQTPSTEEAHLQSPGNPSSPGPSGLSQAVCGEDAALCQRVVSLLSGARRGGKLL